MDDSESEVQWLLEVEDGLNRKNTHACDIGLRVLTFLTRGYQRPQLC